MLLYNSLIFKIQLQLQMQKLKAPEQEKLYPFCDCAIACIVLNILLLCWVWLLKVAFIHVIHLLVYTLYWWLYRSFWLLLTSSCVLDQWVLLTSGKTNGFKEHMPWWRQNAAVVVQAPSILTHTQHTLTHSNNSNNSVQRKICIIFYHHYSFSSSNLFTFRFVCLAFAFAAIGLITLALAQRYKQQCWTKTVRWEQHREMQFA